MELHVERDANQRCWTVTGGGVNARVYGSVIYGPNGAMDGKGAMKHRAAILEAVEKFRRMRRVND